MGLGSFLGNAIGGVVNVGKKVAGAVNPLGGVVRDAVTGHKPGDIAGNFVNNSLNGAKGAAVLGAGALAAPALSGAVGSLGGLTGALSAGGGFLKDHLGDIAGLAKGALGGVAGGLGGGSGGGGVSPAVLALAGLQAANAASLGKKANDFSDKAWDLSNDSYTSRAGLRDAGVKGLLANKAPDLSGLAAIRNQNPVAARAGGGGAPPAIPQGAAPFASPAGLKPMDGGGMLPSPKPIAINPTGSSVPSLNTATGTPIAPGSNGQAGFDAARPKSGIDELMAAGGWREGDTRTTGPTGKPLFGGAPMPGGMTAGQGGGMLRSALAPTPPALPAGVGRMLQQLHPAQAGGLPHLPQGGMLARALGPHAPMGGALPQQAPEGPNAPFRAQPRPRDMLSLDAPEMV